MSEVLTSKQQKYLSNSTWYHATTLEHFHNIHNIGVKADVNKDISDALDFGYGFYLTDNADKAERFICKLMEYGDRDGVPVIIEFIFDPLPWFNEDEYLTKIFDKHDNEFGLFVFENRDKNKNSEFQHSYDSIYGVMSDSLPIRLFIEYKAGILSKEDVITGLLKPSSMKQLSLHNQELCDKLKVSRAYSLDITTGERRELNINELN